MNKALRALCAILALLFLAIGLRWIIDPAGVAPQFGLHLAAGLGLSSQVGDMAGYFLFCGTSILLALLSGRSTWFLAPTALLLLTACGRVLAWLLHGAPFATALIAVEVVTSVLLLLAARTGRPAA